MCVSDKTCSGGEERIMDGIPQKNRREGGRGLQQLKIFTQATGLGMAN